MKKTVALLLIICMCSSLFACTAGQTEEPTDPFSASMTWMQEQGFTEGIPQESLDA